MRQIRRTARQVRRVYYSHGLSRTSAIRHARYQLADSVTIVASKRTGSTWVLELLSGGSGVCPIFEPLEGDPWARGSRRGRRTSSGPTTGYPTSRPSSPGPCAGAHVTRWSMRLATPRRLLAAERFVVKHVQLCRASGWLAATFPDTPIVLVVRHPCAVVQSMLTVRWSGSTADEILAKRPEPATRRALEILDGRELAGRGLRRAWASEMLADAGRDRPAARPLVAYESVVDDPAGTRPAHGAPAPASPAGHS